MLEIEIPGKQICKLDFLVLDLNGTIAIDGEVNNAVAQKIRLLGRSLAVHIVTAGTHGKLERLQTVLGIEVHQITPQREAEQKQSFIKNLGVEKTVSIGNGLNDVLMLKDSAISIAVIGGEGASSQALLAADIVVNSIVDALDLLAKPRRLIATLRK